MVDMTFSMPRGDRRMWGTLQRLLCLICLLGGMPIAAPAMADDAHLVEIRVARHETLIGICRRYLEHPEEWRRIATLNRLATPDRISPGQRISLPADMLKGVPLEGTVTLLKGTVARKSGSDAGWTELRPRDVIRAGTSLRTGADSAAEITFEDGTSFFLRENTELTVRKAGKGALHLLRTLYLESGKVISRIRAVTGRDSRFEVETPSALAAVRGTEYRVAVDTGQTTRCETLEHSVNVSAGGAAVVVHEGEGSIVRKNEPPTRPVRLPDPPEPKDLAPSYGDRVSEIRFSRVPNAAHYRVVLARDPAGKLAVRTAVIGPDEPFRFEGVDNGSYHLVASSIDGNGLEGALSLPRVVTVRKKPLPPTIISPSEGAAAPEMPLKIQWHQVMGVAAYQVQIATDPGFSGPDMVTADLKGTVHLLKEPHAGSYYLRVRSLTEEGTSGDWSAVRRFSVTRLKAPTLGKGDNDDNIYLEWEPLQGVSRYRLQISRQETFDVVAIDMTLGQPRAMLVTPLPAGTYYVRTAGVDSDWSSGGFSQTGSFVVEKKKGYLHEILGAMGLL